MIRRFLPSFLRPPEIADLEDQIQRAAELAEGALLGTEGRRAIWTDTDYLVAVLSVLTNADRARHAAYAAIARTPAEDDPPIQSSCWIFPGLPGGPPFENGWGNAPPFEKGWQP